MKKIAVLNDLSGMGKCSLTAAIPVISVMGVQACPLPTAVLSNQTGYASYYCDDYTDHMDSIMDEWKKREFHPDGIYTGYLAGEHQADKVLRFLEMFAEKDTLILVDPVLGDRGTVYAMYTEEHCIRMRRLVQKANVITPNLTEALLLLYGKQGMLKYWENLKNFQGQNYLAEIEKIGKELTEQFQTDTVITGVDYLDEDKKALVGNLVFQKGEYTWVFSEKEGGSYSGTGDLFASVLSAGMVRGLSAADCVKRVVRFLSKAIHDTVLEGTDRNDGVCFETYLYELMEE